ncbi:hypothetical protein RRG08_012555 [Elysia crispata]|uniref:Uncharacterized protein n=1 Tax=Elysia crispata TaxID=231223 RepID=A0AAE1AP97_9GAST|nr:hypothetical protein RRG08_012555 [Elysia crispata]
MSALALTQETNVVEESGEQDGNVQELSLQPSALIEYGLMQHNSCDPELRWLPTNQVGLGENIDNKVLSTMKHAIDTITSLPPIS